MKLRSFFCAGLNHYLNFDIPFHDDVSFLHGINGSGKTSTLRAIAALLTPDPIWLVSSPFDIIRIEFDHKDQLWSISAVKHQLNEIIISISGGTHSSSVVSEREVSLISRYAAEESYRYLGMDTDEATHRLQKFIETNETLFAISKLPAPIFLGLDRTTLTPLDASYKSSRGGMTHPPSRTRTVHPYFRTQLDDAVWEAERILVDQLTDLSAKKNKIFEKLRNQFVLSLFHVPDGTLNRRKQESSESYYNKYREMYDSITDALIKINISNEDIKVIVAPFFDRIENLHKSADKAMKKYEREQRKDANIRPSDELMTLMNRFYEMQPYLSMMETAISKIEKSNSDERAASKPVEEYKLIINRFLEDSRKNLVFTNNSVKVSLPSGDLAEITSLSSGERQLFVLITHLVFNPQMRGANVLLIDEPELSLHLKWQRQFVPAIRQASPQTQMILATHSPEIIFNRTDRLIPLR